MSEILHYSLIRASGTLPSGILPPGISEPFAPRPRPVRLRSRHQKPRARLRRLVGRHLLRLGAFIMRLGQRWTAPTGETGGRPLLRAVH